MAPLPELLTVTEVAEVLRVHPATVRRWAREGVLTATDTPGRSLRFRREDIERLLVAGDAEIVRRDVDEGAA